MQSNKGKIRLTHRNAHAEFHGIAKLSTGKSQRDQLYPLYGP